MAQLSRHRRTCFLFDLASSVALFQYFSHFGTTPTHLQKIKVRIEFYRSISGTGNVGMYSLDVCA